MKAIARSYMWWLGIDKDIENLAKSCLPCHENKSQPATACPFLDKTFLVVVDAHSKWPEVIEMPSTTSFKTTEALRNLFEKYGLPEQLVSDNGPQFTSEEFAEFMKVNGIKHIRSAPYHLSTNGLAKRFVQTFKKVMKTSAQDEPNLSTQLSQFLLGYRSTPHATTNVSPGELFLQQKLCTRFDLLKPNIESVVNTKQSNQKTHYDKHVKQQHFVKGQLVMVKDFILKKWTPGEIVNTTGPLSYSIQIENGRIIHRHVDHIKFRSVITVNSPSQPYTNDTMEFDLFPTPSVDYFEPTPVVQQEPVQERRYPLRSSGHAPLRYQPGLLHLTGEEI